MEEHETVFRKKAMDSISSPEQLTDYLRVTNPGIWAVLAAVLLFLAGLFSWAVIGTLETSAPAKIVVENHMAQIVPTESGTLGEGMPLRIAGQEFAIASVGVDEYGRVFGTAELPLPDGVYDGVVVTEQTRPIDFLFESR